MDRPIVKETTAMGAAYLAGLSAGLLPPPEQFGDSWRLERRFTPRMDTAMRKRKLLGWKSAVRSLLGGG